MKQYQNILLVDDIPENLVLLERILVCEDRKFLQATSGEEALDKIQNSDIALIILDVQMPGMNGFETATHIRNIKKMRHIPIIFVTAISYEMKHVSRGYEVGAVEYIPKPLNIDILRRKVKVYLDLDHLIKDANLETIYRLSIAAEFRDNKNTAHLDRISEYSKIIAKALRFNDNFVEMIKMASPMHDIGKIGISDKIIFKSGEYTTSEFEEMKRHPDIGHLILQESNSELIQMADRIAYAHHEKMDGSGYPQGIKGNEIPIEARIVAVADVYDALREERVYKPAFGLEKTIELMKSNVGCHFDPEIFGSFINSLGVLEEIRETMTEQNNIPPISSKTG